MQFNCDKNLQKEPPQETRKKEIKEKEFFNKGNRLNGSGSTFEKHQNTGGSLMKELQRNEPCSEWIQKDLVRLSSHVPCTALIHEHQYKKTSEHAKCMTAYANI